MKLIEKIRPPRGGGWPRRGGIVHGIAGMSLASGAYAQQAAPMPELVVGAGTAMVHGRAAVRAVGRRLSGVKAWVGSSTEPVLNRLPFRLFPFAASSKGEPIEPPLPPVPPNSVHVSVFFALATYALLECIADRNGVSMPQALRDSIVLRNYIERAIDGGGRVLIDRGGRLTELALA